MTSTRKGVGFAPTTAQVKLCPPLAGGTMTKRTDCPRSSFIDSPMGTP